MSKLSKKQKDELSQHIISLVEKGFNTYSKLTKELNNEDFSKIKSCLRYCLKNRVPFAKVSNKQLSIRYKTLIKESKKTYTSVTL